MQFRASVLGVSARVGVMRQLTESERQQVWQLWWQGCSQNAILRATGLAQQPVAAVLAEHGGIRPPVRQRATQALSLAEREEISRGLEADYSQAAIARQVSRSESTVSREIARNGGREQYRAHVADEAADRRARRPKTPKLAARPELAQWVEHALQHYWSPQQIARRLRRDYPGDRLRQVSHETIYRSLYVQTRGELRRELTRYLRQRRRLRQPRNRTDPGRGQIPDKVMLAERPPEAADRAVPGHWEGDLVLGSGGSAIATLVERHSRYAFLIALPHGKTVPAVTDALTATIQRLPAALQRSITWDQGKEMSTHAQFTLATGIPVYFCPPGQPWLRGSNENTNGLIRQLLPKGTNLAHHNQTDLDHIAWLLNTRPRKTLNYATPTEQLTHTLATTP